jgi:hypothetical protein
MEGGKAAELLAEAVATYRSALEVRTREKHPQYWSTTQDNLGNALREKGIRAEGATGAELLGEAWWRLIATHSKSERGRIFRNSGRRPLKR